MIMVLVIRRAQAMVMTHAFITFTSKVTVRIIVLVVVSFLGNHFYGAEIRDGGAAVGGVAPERRRERRDRNCIETLGEL